MSALITFVGKGFLNQALFFFFFTKMCICSLSGLHSFASYLQFVIKFVVYFSPSTS